METIFERRESQVRSYCRAFPATFTRADGALVYDDRGREYLDFFAGAGALNYGHNPPELRDALIEYLESGGIAHSLDLHTAAKASFLEAIERRLLTPRGLDYRVQFPGPTGTNAVEAALKLARKLTGRQKVLFFTNAFHGMTLGALAVTGNSFKRHGAGATLGLGICMPYCGYLGAEADTVGYIERFLVDEGSGVDLPAAIILETVQAEGGIYVASPNWLRAVAELCQRLGVVLIVDDIQVGCGRTGPFFSFERAGITPDIVCLSKSLSGFGQPLAVTLIKPELDQWEPGEHNGTFRGNNLAFVTGARALERYWADDALSRQVTAHAQVAGEHLAGLAARFDALCEAPRGIGLIQGLPCSDPQFAARVTHEAFQRGLIMETSGPDGAVLKLLPPLTLTGTQLERGLDILGASMHAAADAGARARRVAGVRP
jgi:diaminobutyrate-2-oxoglutarate transaminase